MRSFTLAATVAASAMVAAAPAQAATMAVGQPAPEFQVTTFDGRRLSSADLKGKVVVVNFWATWCAPCKRELPLLESYYRLQKKFGLEIVAVTTEDEVPMIKLKPLAEALTMPLAKGFRGAGYRKVKAVPTNYVIDRTGVLRYAQAGAFNLDQLNRLLIPLLQEPAPEAAQPAPAPGAG